MPDPYLQAKIAEIEQHLNNLTEQIESKNTLLKDQSDDKSKAEREFQQKRTTQEQRKRQLWEQIGRYHSHAERAQRYHRVWETFSNLEPAQQAKQREIDESLEHQNRVRSRQKQKLATLSAHFDTTLKSLLGEQAGGEIEISALGVFPRPNAAAAASGAALTTSSTVLGFDLACVVASICGLGHHIRFLMHDSPREADMEAAMYHRLLLFAAELESVFGSQPPSFQYIVTTTTQPPAELAKEPYVCATLHARDNDGLLLKCRF